MFKYKLYRNAAPVAEDPGEAVLDALIDARHRVSQTIGRLENTAREANRGLEEAGATLTQIEAAIELLMPLG